MRQILMVDKRELESIIEEKFNSLIEEKCYNRYYTVVVGVKEVAHIHNLSVMTVKRYIARGMITPLERDSSQENLKFRLSDVLKMDFNEFLWKLNFM